MERSQGRGQRLIGGGGDRAGTLSGAFAGQNKASRSKTNKTGFVRRGGGISKSEGGKDLGNNIGGQRGGRGGGPRQARMTNSNGQKEGKGGRREKKTFIKGVT